jgi:hypothetical protein
MGHTFGGSATKEIKFPWAQPELPACPSVNYRDGCAELSGSNNQPSNKSLSSSHMASVLIKRRVLDHRRCEKLGEPGGGMLPAGGDRRERVLARRCCARRDVIVEKTSRSRNSFGHSKHVMGAIARDQSMGLRSIVIYRIHNFLSRIVKYTNLKPTIRRILHHQDSVTVQATVSGPRTTALPGAPATS